MCLTDMISDWSDQWHELFLGDVPDARPVAVEKSVPCRLHIERLRRTILDLGHRIARKEEQAQFLAERVRIFMRVGDQANAWGLAMEIDRQREFVAAERHELEEARKEYRQVIRRLRRMHGAPETPETGFAVC
jgi:hypothetical protein